MNHTQNLQLPQWEAADRVTRSDINGAFSAIDAAIGALSGAAQLAAGSYAGTGEYGSSNRNSLTFPFTPKLVFLFGPQEASDWKYFTLCLPQKGNGDTGYGPGSYRMTNVTVSGSTISWYSTANATAQYNVSGKTYYWVAVG